MASSSNIGFELGRIISINVDFDGFIVNSLLRQSHTSDLIYQEHC